MDKQAPRESQRLRIESFIDEPTRAGLIADEPGYGKTLVAVEIALRFERTLTVGIRDTFHQFADLMAAQSDGTATLRRIDSTKAGRAAFDDLLTGKPGHYFTGSQFLVTQDWDHEYALDSAGQKIPLFDKVGQPILNAAGEQTYEKKAIQRGIYKKMTPVDVLIWDEAHVIQNRKSRGFKTARWIAADRRLGMSGTPFGNNFEGIWAVCRWLWPDLIDASFIRWKRDWCTVETRYIPGGKSVEKVTGEIDPGRFVQTLPFYIRAEAEPLPAPIPVYVELTRAQREQYRALEEELVVWIDDNPLAVDLPAVLRQRLRTATLGEMNVTEDGEMFFDDDCQSAKLQALHGVLHGYWGGREQAIIGMDSKRFAYVTYRRMLQAGEKVALWTGDTSSKDRDAIKAAFLAGEVQYIVATIASMSTGLDGFQRVASKMVWLNELDGNEAVNAQFVRRLFRPGRVGDFESVKILAKDTLDDGVMGSNLARSIANRNTLRTAA